MGLPNPLVGAYWACYDSSCPPLSQVPTNAAGVGGYNTLFIFQILPDGTTGRLSFDSQSVESTAQLKTDIAAKRAAGISILLSFGGSGGYLAISSQAIASTFVTSLEAIIAELGPVDGLDWDIEGGPMYAAEMTSIGQQLKAKYGNGFSITMAPGPWDTAAAAVAKTMYAGGALDVVGPQFYEQGTLSHTEMVSNVTQRITDIWLPAVDGNKDALMIGFELAASDNTAADYMAPATAVGAWQASPVRGAFVWNIAEETADGHLFLNDVAPAIVGSSPAPAPTPPAPPPAHHRPHHGGNRT
jgi:hypothetical protein